MLARPALPHAARTALTVVISLGVLVAGLVWVSPAATADTGAAPVITSDVDVDGDGVGDATVSGTHALKATTDQPYAELTVSDGPAGAGNADVTQVVPVADGVAQYDWPSWGFGSRPALSPGRASPVGEPRPNLR